MCWDPPASQKAQVSYFRAAKIIWNVQTGPLCRGHTVAGRRRQEVGHLDKEEPRSSGVTQTWWLKGNIGSISLIDINVFEEYKKFEHVPSIYWMFLIWALQLGLLWAHSSTASKQPGLQLSYW